MGAIWALHLDRRHAANLRDGVVYVPDVRFGSEADVCEHIALAEVLRFLPLVHTHYRVALAAPHCRVRHVTPGRPTTTMDSRIHRDGASP